VSDRLNSTARPVMIPYKDRPRAYILVTKLDEPYGSESKSVVSIGCTLKGEIYDPSWKVHVPLELVPDLITALQEVVK
jgi:hypothetical protein